MDDDLNKLFGVVAQAAFVILSECGGRLFCFTITVIQAQ